MISHEQLLIFMLVLARVTSFIAFFPLFSKKQLPNTVKVGLAAALTFFWMGHASSEAFGLIHANETSLIHLLLLTIREVTIGVVLSVAMGLMFWPAKVAGAYVGQELGLSLASISDPGSQDGATLVTRIFETFAIFIFFVGNIHHFMILVLHHSIDTLTQSASLTELPYNYMITLFNRVSDQGLLIAGPIMIMSMMVTLVLAFLNRAAPALNLFSVGMSIRSGLGVFSLVLLAPVLLSAIHFHLIQVQESLQDLIRIMSL